MVLLLGSVVGLYTELVSVCCTILYFHVFGHGTLTNFRSLFLQNFDRTLLNQNSKHPPPPSTNIHPPPPPQPFLRPIIIIIIITTISKRTLPHAPMHHFHDTEHIICRYDFHLISSDEFISFLILLVIIFVRGSLVWERLFLMG